MSLKLVTGPANAAKAGHVLGAFRARLAEEPLLVVPALRDVEHAQREAAERGAVLGARVVRFAWLFDEMARRCADRRPGRRASALQRELIVAATVRSLELEALAESASRPGFVRAATRLVAELERSLVEPQRLTQALREWAGDGPRATFASELAAIYRGYRSGLEAARLSDDELYAWRAVDALREHPDRWGATPVFVYGFDDFTDIELDAIETLADARGRGGDGVAALRARAHRVPGAVDAVPGADPDRGRRPRRARGDRRPLRRRVAAGAASPRADAVRGARLAWTRATRSASSAPAASAPRSS